MGFNSGFKGLNQAGWDGRGMWHASKRREKITGFWWGNLKERDYLEEKCVDGKDNSEMHFREMRWEGVDWVHLVQNRDKWLAVVSTVMNSWVFILLSERQKFVDFVDWFLFNSATCFGSVSAVVRWECWFTKRANRGERPHFTNSGYSIMVKFYDYYSENGIISDILLFSE